jgi:cullin 1
MKNNSVDNDIILFKDGWKIINNFIEQLITFIQSDYINNKVFNNKEYMKIYTLIYNLSIQRDPWDYQEELYNAQKEITQLYFRNTVLKKLNNSNNLIIEMNKQWEKFKIYNRWMSLFFMYLDRFWILSTHNDNINKCCYNLFEEEIYEKLNKRLTDDLMDLIKNNHIELENNYILIKNIISIYEILSSDLNYYINDFEEPFLEYQTNNYKILNQKIILNISDINIIHEINNIIKKEMKEKNKYINNITEKKLLDILINEFVVSNINILIDNEYTGFNKLLKNELYDDLSIMYSLFKKTENNTIILQKTNTNGLSKMNKLFFNFINEDCENIIDNYCNNLKDINIKKDIILDKFIKGIIKLYNFYININLLYFQKDTTFSKSILDCITKVVNRDNYNMALLLSKYCDKIFKKGASKFIENTIIEEMNNLIILFNCLDDKDVFLEFYRILLSKRLLNNTSNSNYDERKMISKLKLNCGNQNVSNLVGMLNDIEICKDLSINYKKNDTTNKLNVSVFTHGFWPTYTEIKMNIPNELQNYKSIFEKYYKNNTSSKKLSWIYNLGSCELIMEINNKKYIMMLSLLQSCVLMMFNNSINLSFNDIYNNLSMKVENIYGSSELVLKKILHSLIFGKYKILIKQTKNKSIKNTDVFNINTKFKCKLNRFKIIMPVLKENKIIKKVDDNRKFIIESNIVRIMKIRKELEHNILVSELCSHVTLFIPSIKIIKRCIEQLIDKEYLERHNEKKNVYTYLS